MNILVLGVNTRPVVNSAKKLGHTVYSASYFNPVDLNADYKQYIIHNNANNNNNNNNFYENYNEKKLLNMAENIINNYDIDKIIISSGIFENKNSKIPKNWNVLGNSPKIINKISNKYKITKQLNNLGYCTPLTYKVHNKKQVEKYLYMLKSIVIKTQYGSGGINTYSLNINNISNIDNVLNNLNITYPVIVQEKIHSNSYSASFIENVFLCFNKQLINNNIYVGNITPYNFKIKLKDRDNIDISNYIDDFKDIINYYNLHGMNGIDFMIKDGKPCILEINPRILGTYETIEYYLNKNLVDLIIKLYNNSKPNNIYNIIKKSNNTNNSNQYIKKILFAKRKLLFNFKNFLNYYNISNANNKNIVRIGDLPQNNTIIQEKEPILTLISNTDKHSEMMSFNLISKMVVDYEQFIKGRNI